jgi:predicted transglutaminase-like cysteine proteinase
MLPGAALERRAPALATRASPVWLVLLGCLQVSLAQAPGFTGALLDAVGERYGADARERVINSERLIVENQERPERDKLTLVNDFFNRVRFTSDEEHWGQRDYWATPLELLGTHGGDCEDFSIAKYFTLRELGVPTERLRITYVRARQLDQAHMVVAYYPTPDAQPLILDNLDRRIRPGSGRPDLVPVYGFNGDGLWRSRERGRGERVGGPNRIRLWRDLTSRMARERSPGSPAAPGEGLAAADAAPLSAADRGASTSRSPARSW